MGRIKEYFPSQAAKVELTNGTLKVGDKILIMSGKSGYETYFTQRIHDIRVDGKNVQKTGQATIHKPIMITTKLDQPANGGKIDLFIKFTDETYRPGHKKARYSLK